MENRLMDEYILQYDNGCRKSLAERNASLARAREADVAFESIFLNVADSVEILEVDRVTTAAIALPRLTELAVHPYFPLLSGGPPVFQASHSLRRLHVNMCTTPARFSDISHPSSPTSLIYSFSVYHHRL